MKKYGTTGQATDDNIIRRMRFACWIIRATATITEYIIHIAFPQQQWLATRMRLDVTFICTSPPLL
jgi:hypothetical protein